MQESYAAATSYSMQSGADDRHVEMSLREHLLAAQAGQQLQASSPPSHAMHAAPSIGQHEQRIDPAIAGSAYHHGMSGVELGDSGGEGHLSENRKGRRELSSSKRAAQNRAAQRAFRQRKEEYIKSLKDQVEDYKKLADDYKAIQAENYQLREYVISLQQRLLESQGNFPEPPPNIDLTRTRNDEPENQETVENTGLSASAVDQLQAAAVQAAQEHSEAEFKAADGQYSANQFQDRHMSDIMELDAEAVSNTTYAPESQSASTIASSSRNTPSIAESQSSPQSYTYMTPEEALSELQQYGLVCTSSQSTSIMTVT